MNMTPEFATSNLSKIKPKLRTQGRVSGNFGRNRVLANSPLQTIGETQGSVGNLPKKNEYLNRLSVAYHTTTDNKLKQFIFEEIRKIKVQNGTWY
jgi:hypothetical protein